MYFRSMRMTMADNLAARIKGALCDSSVQLWFSEIATDLADATWHNLERDFCLTEATYGTARMLRRDPTQRRLVVAHVGFPSDRVSRESIPIELLSEDLASQCAGSEVRFFGAEEVLGHGVAARVEEALEILSTVPGVLPTICSLIRALHLIDSADDDLDVSFSDPGLPFSAFVSVPGPSVAVGGLRVAEALLHEAMHLQLTLAEAVVPLVISSDRTYFSPWRNEYRTTQGVLHALYVFRVIDTFLSAAILEGSARLDWQRHARERRETIARQVQEIDDFRECVDLTADGAAFVARLLD